MLALVVASCARASARPLARSSTDPAAASAQFATLTSTSRYTVLLFFSRHCSTLRLHDARLRELFARYHRLGVSFLAVDAEIDSTDDIVRAEGLSRRYPFPIVRDQGAALAREYGAAYASEVLLFGRDKRVLYRGAIDSDRIHLHGDATTYLADALADVTYGTPVRRREAAALGCTLRLR